MTLYARAYRGAVYHIVDRTLSQSSAGWPPALCRFRPKRWDGTTNDPQRTPVCSACTVRIRRHTG